jgi:general stress protein 26
MDETALQDKVWAALETGRICMLSTIVDGMIRSWPMSGYADREHHRVLFVTHRSTEKLAEVRDARTVSIAILDEDHNFHAAITCEASLVEDTELLRRIWTPLVGAWFPHGPDDPDVALLALEPVAAEVWNGPSSSVVVALKLATARLLGRTPDLGGNTTIDMR